MPHELAAARRLLKAIDSVHCGVRVAPGQIIETADVIAVADAFLAEHDPTPITYDDAERLLADSELLLSVRSGVLGVSYSSLIPLSTLGHLRSLCRVLKIPMKETP